MSNSRRIAKIDSKIAILEIEMSRALDRGHELAARKIREEIAIQTEIAITLL